MTEFIVLASIPRTRSTQRHSIQERPTPNPSSVTTIRVLPALMKAATTATTTMTATMIPVPRLVHAPIATMSDIATAAPMSHHDNGAQSLSE